MVLRTDSIQARLRGLGGFRNLLVHGYLRLDPEKVAAHLGQAPAIRGWLQKIFPEGERSS